jgi:hypothetical protein
MRRWRRRRRPLVAGRLRRTGIITEAKIYFQFCSGLT